MAKNKPETVVKKDVGVLAEPKTAASKPPHEPQIGLEKYFQLVDPKIHIYTRAALVEQYRGIIKNERAWENEMQEHVGE